MGTVLMLVLVAATPVVVVAAFVAYENRGWLLWLVGMRVRVTWVIGGFKSGHFYPMPIYPVVGGFCAPLQDRILPPEYTTQVVYVRRCNLPAVMAALEEAERKKELIIIRKDK